MHIFNGVGVDPLCIIDELNARWYIIARVGACPLHVIAKVGASSLHTVAKVCMHSLDVVDEVSMHPLDIIDEINAHPLWIIDEVDHCASLKWPTDLLSPHLINLIIMESNSTPN